MAKPNIPDAIRDCVAQTLELCRKKNVPIEWNQSVHSIAVGYAAAEAASAGDVEPLAFAETYGGLGFLGNASQFAQVLDRLDPSDACYVKRPESIRSKLSMFK